MKLTKDSLVLYKQSPALVTGAGDKIDIQLPGGKTRSVREKDVLILHPGPTVGFPDLESQAPEGQPEEAWELLQGETPSLTELAEIVYGEHTPSTAWMAFKLLNRTPWFQGTPEAIIVADEQSVIARKQADAEKAEAEAKWEDFIQRFKTHRIDREADEPFLRDLEMYALGKSKGSRILKALGKTQSPENAHRTMLASGAVDGTWNPHPLRLGVPLEAPDVALEIPQEVPRLDLTSVEAFAIDDEGNKDPDDAVAWDGERFWVHIADAASLVPAGSLADEVARERSSSLYLPEKTVPMLPPQAAETLGLGLHPTSPALSYAFLMDEDGVPQEFSIHLTTVRVTRLTYAQADERMQEEPFATMRRFTEAFHQRRQSAGAISIRMPEVKVRVNENGEVSITSLPERKSREVVTEAMLMAGTYAAQWCQERQLPIPFAVQEISDSSGEKRDDATSSQEESLNAEQPDYVAQFAKRRGMKRSRTTLECSPHSGLGLETYSRVTSPLRRYPDLIASQQIRQAVLGGEILEAEDVLQGLAAYETRSGSLVQSERRSNLFWKIHWLKARPGYTCEAIMVDRRERQGFFLLPEIALETRVAVKGEMAPGTWVRLKLKEADVAESTVLFTIVEKLEA